MKNILLIILLMPCIASAFDLGVGVRTVYKDSSLFDAYGISISHIFLKSFYVKVDIDQDNTEKQKEYTIPMGGYPVVLPGIIFMRNNYSEISNIISVNYIFNLNNNIKSYIGLGYGSSYLNIRKEHLNEYNLSVLDQETSTIKVDMKNFLLGILYSFKNWDLIGEYKIKSQDKIEGVEFSIGHYSNLSLGVNYHFNMFAK